MLVQRVLTSKGKQQEELGAVDEFLTDYGVDGEKFEEFRKDFDDAWYVEAGDEMKTQIKEILGWTQKYIETVTVGLCTRLYAYTIPMYVMHLHSQKHKPREYIHVCTYPRATSCSCTNAVVAVRYTCKGAFTQTLALHSVRVHTHLKMRTCTHCACMHMQTHAYVFLYVVPISYRTRNRRKTHIFSFFFITFVHVV